MENKGIENVIFVHKVLDNVRIIFFGELVVVVVTTTLWHHGGRNKPVSTSQL